MNWKAYFVIGIILSVSPFQFTIYDYIFQYANLGYGLMLFSFIVKDRKPENAVIGTAIVMVLLLSLFNAFPEYFLVQFVLHFVIALVVFFRSERKIAIWISLLLFILFPPMIIIVALNFLGLWNYRIVLDIGFYTFPTLAALAVIFSKNLNTAHKIETTEEK